jgi:pyruvate kinase
MRTIAREIENDCPERETVRVNKNGDASITDSVTSSVVKTAHDIGAKVIVALTDSGFTARMISRHKPHAVVLSLSPFQKTSNKLNLSFGCLPVTVPTYKTIDDVLKIVREFCIKEKLAKKGDKVVIAGGVPFNTKGLSTNMLISIVL